MLARPAVAVQCIWGRAWKRSDHWSCGMSECWSLAGRSYWIPGSYAPALSEKGNSLLRLLNKKGFREESMTKVELYAIGTSTTLESNKSLLRLLVIDTTASAGHRDVCRLRAMPRLHGHLHHPRHDRLENRTGRAITGQRLARHQRRD